MLRWGTGFDGMKTGNDRRDSFSQLGWYGLPGGANPGGMDVGPDYARFSGKGMHMGNSNTTNQMQANYLVKSAGSVVTFTEFYQGAAMYMTSATNYSGPFIGMSNTGTCLFSVLLMGFGQIELWRSRPNYANELLWATSEPGSFTEETWNYIEVGGLLIDDVSGWITVRVNTVPVIQLVSTITDPAGLGANSYILGYGHQNVTGQGNTDAYWDDLYVCDAVGSAPNNTFLGNTRVQALLPNAAGDSTDFTPVGAATNWEAAGNEDIDDTMYNFSAVNGDYDLYNMTPLINTPQVFGVQVSIAYRQDDATQRSVKNVIKSGATEVEGTEFFTAGNYTFSTDMFETDPDTTVAWLYPAVNLVQIGPKVES